MGDATAIFSIHDQKDIEIHEVVQQVYDALKEKGYNPVNQLVGYILSEDPTYITTYKGARSLIRKVDRDDLLQAMLRSYLNVCESLPFACCPTGRQAFCFINLSASRCSQAHKSGRVNSWFTTTSYSQPSRALRSCFSKASEPSNRWMR